MTHVKQRWFWWALLALTLVAAGFRLLIYDYSLPYVSHPDEPNWYLHAAMWRGVPEADGRIVGYPPFFMSVNWVVQTLVEDIGGGNMTDSFRVLRLLAMTNSLVAMIFIALTARVAAGNVAGLLAGGLYAMAPTFLDLSINATTDTWVYMWTAISVWLAVVALTDPTKRHWAVWSVFVGLIDVHVKYQMLPVLGAGGIVALLTLREDRKKGLRLIALQAAMVAAVGFWLVFIWRANRMDTYLVEDARTSGLSDLFDPVRVIDNILYAFVPPGAWLTGVTIVLGVVAFFVARRFNRPTVDWRVPALLLFPLITLPWLVSFFSHVRLVGRIHDIIPAAGLVCVLFGVAAAQIIDVFPRRSVGLACVLIPIAAFGFVPYTLDDIEMVQGRRLPESRVALRYYVDDNLEPGTVIVNNSNHKTFNPSWGGIPHKYWFGWQETSDVTQYSVDEWRDERSLTYAALDVWRVDNLADTPDGAAYLDDLYFLRSFNEDSSMRGPRTYLYRLYPPQTELDDVTFGERITLRGFDAERADESLRLRFYWQASETPQTDYSLFLHLVPTDAYQVLAQVDGAPARRITPTWDRAEETLISQWHALPVPADLPPGEYRVVMGLYDYTNGLRLPVGDGDFYELTTVTVREGTPVDPAV